VFVVLIVEDLLINNDLDILAKRDSDDCKIRGNSEGSDI
jgi:hypothetical protein